MRCERCQGLLVVETLPLLLEPERYYSQEFGYVRCVNCGDEFDLSIYRQRERAKLEHLWKLSSQA